jgi:hypothetical protein
MSAWSAFTNAFKRPQALRGSAVASLEHPIIAYCAVCCGSGSCQWEREWGQLPTPGAGRAAEEEVH